MAESEVAGGEVPEAGLAAEVRRPVAITPVEAVEAVRMEAVEEGSGAGSVRVAPVNAAPSTVVRWDRSVEEAANHAVLAPVGRPSDQVPEMPVVLGLELGSEMPDDPELAIGLEREREVREVRPAAPGFDRVPERERPAGPGHDLAPAVRLLALLPYRVWELAVPAVRRAASESDREPAQAGPGGRPAASEFGQAWEPVEPVAQPAGSGCCPAREPDALDFPANRGLATAVRLTSPNNRPPFAPRR